MIFLVQYDLEMPHWEIWLHVDTLVASWIWKLDLGLVQLLNHRRMTFLLSLPYFMLSPSQKPMNHSLALHTAEALGIYSLISSFRRRKLDPADSTLARKRSSSCVLKSL